ncbi:MAG TPA: hypothetical protein VLZ75_13260 [Chitinophagales bacterium]|nr:hypothetical protein [Chitinophagales bacterium]
MRKRSLLIVVLGYLAYLSLIIGPLIQNNYFNACIKTGLVEYKYIKLREEAQRGSSKYSADVSFNNTKYYLTIEKWEFEKAKKGEMIKVFYCKEIDKVFTETSIWVNKRVSMLAVGLVIFWTVMLKWVFIPYEKNKNNK